MEEKKEKSHEKVHHEHHKKHHTKKTAVRKSHIWMGVSFVLFCLLLITYFNAPAETQQTMESADNQIIFMNSAACTDACTEMEPYVKELADTVGLEFKKGTYGQPVPIPGYVLLYDGELIINGIQEKAQFVQQMCDTTSNADVCAEAQSATAEAQQAALAAAGDKCDTMTKYEKPVLEAWVVSRCPFGVQMMNALQYVQEAIGDNVDIQVRQITGLDAQGNPTAMHGEQELVENERQVCLREEQPDVFWDYIGCYAETGDAATCETTAAVDSSALTDCMENRMLEYMTTEAQDTTARGVTGSPTLLIDGTKVSEYDFGGRSPAALQKLLCCSMETEASSCETQLTATEAPRGFGVLQSNSATGAATTGSAEQLNCN